MPEVTAQYLFDWLQEAGMVSSGASGAVPITNQELMAWSQGAGIELMPWEFSAMRMTSQAYISEFYKSEDFPPYSDGSEMYDPDVVDEKLESIFTRLSKPLKDR